LDVSLFNYEYLDPGLTKVEMSKNDTQFVLHLLKQKEPLKILEIGVAAGGTSYYILNNMSDNARLFSVDISQTYYRNPDKEVGYIAKELCNEQQLAKWTTYFGCDIIDCIDSIGDGIDFLIIDTVHSMPGEFLSFLVSLPHLNNNAMVILHDIHLNYLSPRATDSYCTTLLFSVVSSNNKYIIRDQISNIGAFSIDATTSDNIFNIFHALFISWSYYPDFDMIRYSQYINQFYSERCSFYFEQCISRQKFIVHEKNSIKNNLVKVIIKKILATKLNKLAQRIYFQVK